MITIVIPTYNEELILESNILKLLKFCQKHLTDEWQIIIADNVSTDRTSEVGKKLAQTYKQIKYFYVPAPGKGGAVLKAWANFPAQIYVFMDADLATDLKSLPDLIRGIKQGNDIVAGSRLIAGSHAERNLSRKLFSKSLRLILKIMFKLKIKDAPCGFKAINQKVLETIVPRIKNTTWFFDTEMLILAQQQGFRIKEIPVDWREVRSIKRRSKVKITKVVKDYLKNIFELYARSKK